MTSLPSVRRPALILAALSLAQLIIALDYSIVFIALPDIGSGIGFPGPELQWVIGAYAVTFGGFLLLGGRLSDLLGRRRLFLAGLVVYAVSSAAGGLAQDPGILVAARAIQGLGGALLGPATLSLITTMFAEGAERNRALGVWGATGSSGMVVGALLGGVLTQTLGWRAVFFVNVPLPIAVAVLALLVVPVDTAAERRGGLDIPGGVTATAAALLLVFGLVNGPQNGWGHPLTVVAFTLAATVAAAFVAIESRTADPLVPLRVFRYRSLRTGTMITFMFMATFGASAYFITLSLQQVHHWDALSTGLAYILPCALVLAGSLVGGKLSTVIGVRSTLIIGLSAGAAGTALFAVFLGVTSTFLQMSPGIVVFSFAQGIVWTAMFSAATAGVENQLQGLASGLATSGQQIGAAVGLAVLVAVADAVSGAHPSLARSAGGLQAATYLSAGLILVTIGLALALPKIAAAAPEAPVCATGRTAA